jgi:hypothetical protein
MSGKSNETSWNEALGRKGANGANAVAGVGGGPRDWGRAARAFATTGEAELAAVAELLERASRELEREPGGYATVVALGDGRSERKIGRIDGEDREVLRDWFASVVEEAWEEAGVGAKLRLRLWGPGGKPEGSASFEVGAYVEEDFEPASPAPAKGTVGAPTVAQSAPAPCSKCPPLETKLAERNALVALLESEVMTLRREVEQWRFRHDRIAEPHRRLRAEHAALRQEVDEAAARINEIVGGEVDPTPKTTRSAPGGRAAPWVRLARRTG